MNLEFNYLTDLQLGKPEWLDLRVEALLDGEKVGHLTITFVPREVFEEKFGTIEDFAREQRGIQKLEDYQRVELEPQYRRFRQFHVDTAYVAYVSVDHKYRRRGIAKRLYIEAARWVKERHGLMLAASSLQRPEVQVLWASLVADPDVPTVKLEDDRWALNPS